MWKSSWRSWVKPFIQRHNNRWLRRSSGMRYKSIDSPKFHVRGVSEDTVNLSKLTRTSSGKNILHLWIQTPIAIRNTQIQQEFLKIKRSYDFFWLTYRFRNYLFFQCPILSTFKIESKNVTVVAFTSNFLRTTWCFPFRCLTL